MDNLQRFAKEFIDSTRDHIFIRSEDRLLILRPNRRQHLNETACAMLVRLYAQETVDVAQVVDEIAIHYAVDRMQVAKDLENLLVSLNGLLQNDLSNAPVVKHTPFGSHVINLPVLSEIALTYRCQHKCPFCYADAQQRGSEVKEMTTRQVKACIDKIFNDAKVPTISFTGGEPTLRKDLPELVAHAHDIGMRTNLITNGVKCSNEDFIAALAQAGLDSAQVSIEASTADVHDAITCTPGSFDRAIEGIRHFHKYKIHVHTNTTICAQNVDCVLQMVDFAADELGHEYLSMNMVIRTGSAVGDDQQSIGYSQIEAVLMPIIKRSQERGMRLVWYSPVPLCIFNPVLAGLGSNSCAAADGLLSIAPDGSVLPCSSFQTGIGNLLREPFSKIWNRRISRYWRNKEFLPPGCESCDLKAICCGACPLYWDERKSFSELPAAAQDCSMWANMKWQLKRSLFGRVKGVNIK